jgi:type II secretion system protein G
LSILGIVIGVVLFIIVGAIIGWSQGGNFGEMGCSYITLGLIVLMGFCGYRSYQEERSRTQMVAFKDALVRFYEDCGRYPTSEEGLAALIEKPADCEAWKAYIGKDALTKDPWGHEYVYSVAGETSFEITSGGRKGDETSDDITVKGPAAEQGSGE